jgi:hypothetical protein
MNFGYALIAAAISMFLLLVLLAISNLIYDHLEWHDTRDRERSQEFRRLVKEENMRYIGEAYRLAEERIPSRPSKAYIRHLMITALIVLGFELAGK